MQLSYHRLNNYFGLLMFCIATVVYCMTIEPTASLWDCAEFITSAYKLEVGHPPGAPFFILTANFFTSLTNNTELVARMVNYMSALMSAATIMFLFWTITHLTKKLIIENNESPTFPQTITIIGSGIVGSLAYTFSDTFWFSAVEGEVYAYSSLFTAVVFWLILKWEDDAEEAHSDKWLILIAYMTGLSIGVHLLNLLCLPAIVLVFYYKKYPNSGIKGSLWALIISMLLVAIVLYGIIPGIVKVGGWFELFFINDLGFAFNSGLIIYIVLFIAIIIWGIYESYIDKSRNRMNLSFLLSISLSGIPFYGYGTNSLIIGTVILSLLTFILFSPKLYNKLKVTARTLNTILLCLLLMIIGYSSYSLIVIRSTANTPMDQNSPEDIFTLGSYLGREQYESYPLFYGQAYSSERELKVENGYCVPVIKEGAPIYTRKVKATPNEKDSYIVTGHKMELRYVQNMFFPRMYHPDFTEQYHQWVDIKGIDIPFERCGEPITVNIPTQWENIEFFLKYQLNYMYWRYFMWNFAGRQNDIQGHGEIEHGNWITGIAFIDNLLIGDQTLLPSELKTNKGHNVFYCLPLLLGIIGILFQLYRERKGEQSFWIIFFLFFMTGIAIVIYLNQTPEQPRERDYAYAGSFYAFTIWIGIGVAGIARLLQYKLNKTQAAIIASTSCLFVPIQMGSQTWDDHDRSGRYVCRDIGHNYLQSCSPDNYPIIYTNGDNDTFPLWYNQEVEGCRTDIRVCNLSYLKTDWYIDQMKRPAYHSPVLPIQSKRSEYIQGNNEYILIRPEIKQQIDAYYKADTINAKKNFGNNPYELKNILNYWVHSENEEMHIIPTDSIVYKLDKEAIRRSGMMIPSALQDKIPDYMTISLKGRRAIYKHELMMLELLAGCNWERPIYMATTVGSDVWFCFKDHFCQEGLAKRITPFNTTELDTQIDSEKMYNNLIYKFKWGGLDNDKIYLDNYTRNTCSGLRRTFTLLIKQLLKEGKKEKAITALAKCETAISSSIIPYDYLYGDLDLAECYYRTRQQAKADQIMAALADKSIEYLVWYLSLDKERFYLSKENWMYHLYILDAENKIMKLYKSELSDKYSRRFNEQYELFEERMSQ